jgi:hypothetical protein
MQWLLKGPASSEQNQGQINYMSIEGIQPVRMSHIKFKEYYGEFREKFIMSAHIKFKEYYGEFQEKFIMSDFPVALSSSSIYLLVLFFLPYFLS